MLKGGGERKRRLMGREGGGVREGNEEEK